MGGFDTTEMTGAIMTLQAYEACAAPQTLLIAHGAGHGLSWLVEHDRYKAALLDFFARCGA